jgi:hypothetical protein
MSGTWACDMNTDGGRAAYEVITKLRAEVLALKQDLDELLRRHGTEFEHDQLLHEVSSYRSGMIAAEVAELRRELEKTARERDEQRGSADDWASRFRQAESRACTPAERAVLNACAAFTEEDLRYERYDLDMSLRETQRLMRLSDAWHTAMLDWMKTRRAIREQPEGEEKES